MYILRLYNNDSYKDIKLNKNYYSINYYGNYTVSNTYKRNPLIVIKKEKNKYILKSKKFIFCHGRFTKKKNINLNDNYIIDKDKKLAIFVLNENNNIIEQIDLTNINELTIGSNTTNDIILKDESISSTHLKLYKVGGNIHILNLSKVNGTYVNGKLINDKILDTNDIISIANYDIILKDDKLLFYNLPNEYMIKVENTALNIYPYFKKSLIFNNYDNEKEDIIIDAPNEYTFDDKFDAFSYISLIISVGMTIITITSIKTMINVLIFTVPLIVGSLCYSLYRFLKKKKEHITIKEDIDKNYLSYLNLTEEYIKNKNNNKINYLNKKYPKIENIIENINKLSKYLWSSNIKNGLFIKLGYGDIDSDINILLKEEKVTNNNLLKIKSDNSILKNVPFIIQMPKLTKTVVLGDQKDINCLIKNIIISITSSYDYNDLKIILYNDDLKEYEFLKWLRHCKDNQKYLFSNDLTYIKNILKKNKDALFICPNYELINDKEIINMTDYNIIGNDIINEYDNIININNNRCSYNKIEFVTELITTEDTKEFSKSIAPIKLVGDPDTSILVTFTDDLFLNKKDIFVDVNDSLEDITKTLKKEFNIDNISKYIINNEIVDNKKLIKDLNIYDGCIIIFKNKRN